MLIFSVNLPKDVETLVMRLLNLNQNSKGLKFFGITSLKVSS